MAIRKVTGPELFYLIGRCIHLTSKMKKRQCADYTLMIEAVVSGEIVRPRCVVCVLENAQLQVSNQ